jgi:crotonobetainyl-CoA:carnitine CoA-transferase CaiB-like acyl-CoA transferase
MPGPFEGLKVVEFGRFIAAPYCAQLLADGGADVVKVEPVVGDETRRNGEIVPGEGRQFLNKNRGKRSIAVDLSEPTVLRAVRKVAADADIVVANFRPGQSEKYGLDYDALSAANPRLIYAENTAFGRRGPRAGEPGMDLMMVAYTGLAPNGPNGPADLENPIIDYAAGLLLAWGVSTALYHREKTGRGQRVDVSLLQTSLVLQNNSVNHIDVIDNEWRPTYLERAREALAAGLPWDEVVDIRSALVPHAVNRAYYGFFRTADGVIAIAAPGTGNRKRLLEIVGVEDRWVTEPGWLPEDARSHVRAVHEQVAVRLRKHSTAHWLDLLHSAGIPSAPFRLRDELLSDEQALANGYFIRLHHDLVGDVTVAAPPVKFSETELRATKASPVLGTSTREVLSAAGVSSTELVALIDQGHIVVTD